MQTSKEEFSGWRKYLFPIHRHELPKFGCLFVMFFAIVMAYTSTRLTKDSQALVFGGVGGMIVPFLKSFVLIAAISYTALYAYLIKRFHRSTVFYGTICFFLFFFISFKLFLFPNREAIKLIGLSSWLRGILPLSLTGFVAAVENWDIALFYVMAEMWGSVVLSLQFFETANRWTSTYESKRVYPLFGLFGNIASIFAGYISQWSSDAARAVVVANNLNPGSIEAWMPSLSGVVNTFTICSAAIILSYWVLNNLLIKPTVETKNKSKKKVNAGFIDGIEMLKTSNHVFYIAILVFAYGFCINCVELTWKDTMIHYFNKDPNLYQSYNSGVMMITGVVTVIVSLFISHNLDRVFGWTFSALVTPILVGITGCLFFLSVILYKYGQLDLLAELFGYSPLGFIVAIGALQGIASKGTKYAIFDYSKERAWQAADADEQTVGKSTVDVGVSRTGKWFNLPWSILLLAMFGTLMDSAGAYAITLTATTSAWIYAAIQLGGIVQRKLFESEKKSREEEA